MSVVKISSKGQVVIPKSIRERLGLRNGDKLRIFLEAQKITIVPASAPPSELLVRSTPDAIREISSEAKAIDEEKVRKLLSALGVKS